jgi:soluble lytic murein transglycosylase-like protein
MGIPRPWLPILMTYGFPVSEIKSNPCWGVAAGTWILAVEQMYARDGLSIKGRPVYPGTLPSIPQQFIIWADRAAVETGVPAALILAVAAQESGFDPKAVSDKGAQGLMQFMPGTAARFGLRNPFDPKAAIFAGARYLRVLYQELGSWKLALAGYNAGARSVIDAGYHIPPFWQTQNYVPDVLAKYQRIVKSNG